MKKYKVFCSFGNADRNIKKHELIAVEYGKDIYDVTDKLIKIVCDNSLELPEYQQGYTASAFAPEIVKSHRRVKRYKYIIEAILMPINGLNKIIEYGVMEEMEL